MEPPKGLGNSAGANERVAENALTSIDREASGGWGEIRTHGTLAGTPVFKTGALNRSATHPHPTLWLSKLPQAMGSILSHRVLAPGVIDGAAPQALGRRGHPS